MKSLRNWLISLFYMHILGQVPVKYCPLPPEVIREQQKITARAMLRGGYPPTDEQKALLPELREREP